MRYFFVYLITLFYLLVSLLYPINFKNSTFDVCKIFIEVIIPSIVPMYIISSIITNNRFFIKLSNKILKPFNLFDSVSSSSILLASILVGNPTNTLITLNKYNNKSISVHDTKILLSTSFFNPLFIINSSKLVGLNTSHTFLLLFSLIISNLILIFFNKKTTLFYSTIVSHFNAFDIINTLPNLLLNIFIISIIISYFKIPFIIINKIALYSAIPIEFFDISTGFFNIANMHINYHLKIVILSLLLSTSGFSIITQSIYFVKQKAPDNFRYFIKSILINKIKLMLLNTILFIFLLKLFF